MWNGGLNEGYADIWAISLTQNPVLGYGWDLTDPTVYVRRYDQNRKVYPQDLVGQVHAAPIQALIKDRGVVLLSRESRQSLMIHVKRQWMRARDQHVQADIKLEIVDVKTK